MASSSSSSILFYDDVSNGTTTICWNASCYLDGSILPAPIAIPPLPSDPTPTPIQIHHANRLLPNFLIAAASLLALSFFLLLVSYFLLRLRRRRRRRLLLPAANNDDHQNPSPFPLQDLDLVEQEEDGGGGTHHIWYIRTVGLEESVIKSIASTVYKSGGGLMDGGDCSVCLGEFVDGEVIKLLPKCSHAFHLPCIDTWLRSHVNCPLCRSPVVVVTGELDDASPSEETLSPPATITRGGEENAVVVDLEAGSSSSSSNSRKEENENENGGELQPIRRSVSLDSSSLGVLMLRVELPDEKLGEESKNVEMREVVAPKNEGKGIESLAKWSAEMKRSLSSRSGRLFFTRYARGRSASVLPL